MGWQRVLSHLGAIIIGSLLTKSRIISKDASWAYDNSGSKRRRREGASI
jgi:hypothetical protein